jgi:hypothetical protein
MKKVPGRTRVRIVLTAGLVLLATACVPTFAKGSALVAKSGGGATVRLIWNQAFDADPGDSIAYYSLEVNGTVVDTLAAPKTNCTMAGLASGTHYDFSVTAYSNHGTGTEWSGTLGGASADLGRLSTSFTTPSGSITAGTIACNNGDTDTDGDRLPDWAETNTHVYVNAGNTGTDPLVADTDGDGINDGDETLGTLGGLDLPGLGFKPLKKDLAFEFDWFDDHDDPGTCAAHSHRPTPGAISRLSAAFATGPIANPDGTTGVHVIADYGQGGAFTGGNLVADADGVIAGGVDGSDMMNYKAANFAANRNGYFHYVLLPHRYDTNSASSGQAELGGDDLVVSLYCFHSDGNVANTIMHEVGHNLGLLHGGNALTNYKPNYNSVMNYEYQFPGVDTDCVPGGDGVLDYSTGTRAPLNESALNEAAGICNGVAVDWNQNGLIDSSPVSADINPLPAGDGALGTLTDFNDWAHLFFRGLSDADGASPTQQVVSEQPVPLSAQH